MPNVFDDILGTLFGGADTSAQDFARQSRAEAKQAIDTSTAQARADVLSLFPQANINRNLGFQAGLDVLGQTIPGQLEAFQAGNVGAQENLLAGLPQFRNAILGGQFDPNALQPTEISFDPSFAQQQLPDFATGAAPRTAATQQGQATAALTNLLSGNAALGGAGGGDGDGTGFELGMQGDLSGLLSNISTFLDSPEGKLASAVIPGGGIAQLVNEIFGGEGSQSAGQIGTSSEPGISDAARANRLRAEQRRATITRDRRAASDRAFRSDPGRESMSATGRGNLRGEGSASSLGGGGSFGR